MVFIQRTRLYEGVSSTLFDHVEREGMERVLITACTLQKAKRAIEVSHAARKD